MNRSDRTLIETAAKFYDNARNPAVLAALPELVGKRVLDVGCGAGANARAMVASGAIVTGVTLSCSEARHAVIHRIAATIADLGRGLPFRREARFDIIVFSHVLEHFSDPAVLLIAARPLLAPGGIVVVAVPSVTHYSVRFRLLRGDWTYAASGVLDWTHLRFFSRSGIHRVIDSAGYMTVAERHDGVFPLSIARRILPRRVVDVVNKCAAKRWPEMFATQFVSIIQPR